jgi:hypothetical protein
MSYLMRPKKVDQSKQKIINYLDYYIDSDYFQTEIFALRKRLRLPPQGYKLPKGLKQELDIKGKTDKLFDVPKKIKKEWDHPFREVNLSMKKITKDFPLHNFTIDYFFRIYLFYNERLFGMLSSEFHDIDLCVIEDMPEELRDIYTNPDTDAVLETVQSHFEQYPIIIKLFPLATQRDVISFIKSHWRLIDLDLSQYRKENIKLGKLRKRNSFIKERNEFIYKNRKNPYKKIISLVEEHFSKEVAYSLDEGYIGKIISLEEQRRKEVSLT